MSLARGKQVKPSGSHVDRVLIDIGAKGKASNKKLLFLVFSLTGNTLFVCKSIADKLISAKIGCYCLKFLFSYRSLYSTISLLCGFGWSCERHQNTTRSCWLNGCSSHNCHWFLQSKFFKTNLKGWMSWKDFEPPGLQEILIFAGDHVLTGKPAFLVSTGANPPYTRCKWFS